MQGNMDSVRPTPYEEMPGDEEREKGKHGTLHCLFDDGMRDLISSSDVTPQLTLPGCSKGRDHDQKWNMSTSMIQTYLAMRGPGADIDDPLLDWIRMQDEKNLQDGESG